MNSSSIRIGISCGDLNGVGLEVVLKTFEDPRMMLDLTPILYCGAKAVSLHRKTVPGLEQMQVNGIADAQDAVPKKFNVVHAWEEETNIQLGHPSGEEARFAIMSLEAAAQDLTSGKIDALVTAPIDKHSMEMAGFKFPGHTEFLAHHGRWRTRGADAAGE
jgi:4-hydroxythreonine-4-phosphate dehydrogenase